MNCKEAQDMFGSLRDFPEQHPHRKQVEGHLLGCDFCAAEYHHWEESLDLVEHYSLDVTEEQAEAVNRKVMDRIYAESPWLAPDVRVGSTRRIRRRITIWAVSFVAIFLCSFLFFIYGGANGNKSVEPSTGILPTAVAVSNMDASEGSSFSLPDVSRGVIEPFAAQMVPTYPQYWMILSMAGMVLALFSWKKFRRLKR